jgi:5'-deoxynucleotidase YfbR-like HD superfamily hydrolase
MRTRLDFIMRGGVVKRFHTMHTLHTQSVAEHSFGVSWLVWLLTGGHTSAKLLMAALVHDAAEHVTGDLPAPAKRSLGISAQFAEYEDALLLEAKLPIAELTAYEETVLKLADTADLCLFCIREIELGNSQMRAVYLRGMAYITEMKLRGPAQLELVALIEEKYNDIGK